MVGWVCSGDVDLIATINQVIDPKEPGGVNRPAQVKNRARVRDAERMAEGARKH